MTKERMPRKHRRITERIIVKGMLRLMTPTCLSNGDTDGPIDIGLVHDSISNRALLSGTSIAGALRNYLWEYERGYGVKESREDTWTSSLAIALFGGKRQDDEGDQSPLIVYDAISDKVPTVELRDGVRIDSETGTAWTNQTATGELIGGAKYDLEFLAAGTAFPICFELLIDAELDKERLREGLAIALSGLEKQEIGLGMKKQRGFGQCKVDSWQVWQFDLKNDTDRLAWLGFDRGWESHSKSEPQQGNIAEVLNVSLEQADKREFFQIEATMGLDGSLLIRSGHVGGADTPDVVHLHSQRNGHSRPVLSGTSLAGVLLHRAERIVNTLCLENTSRSPNLVDNVFGFVHEDKSDATVADSIAAASRLLVSESEVENATDLIQTRIAIDRFTGGAYHGALLEEQPVWGNDDTQMVLTLRLKNPLQAEIGLLLLLLKDLWTGDLPVGGESSTGRGRLRGKAAVMTHRTDVADTQYTISLEGERLNVSDGDALEDFVSAFCEYVRSPEGPPEELTEPAQIQQTQEAA